jgi:hypothetical protein
VAALNSAGPVFKIKEQQILDLGQSPNHDQQYENHRLS